LGFVRGSIVTGNVNAPDKPFILWSSIDFFSKKRGKREQWRDDADKFFKKLTEKIIPNRNIVAHTAFRANDKGMTNRRQIPFVAVRKSVIHPEETWQPRRPMSAV
jgi:hypothetical protein